MADNSIPRPQYQYSVAVRAALAAAEKALLEVLALRRQPGPQGEPGPEGKRGRDGAVGPKGDIGPEGRGIQGPAGLAGKDGLGFDNIEAIDTPEEYGFCFKQDGQVVKEFKFVRPIANLADCYQGVWKEGGTYTRGMAATFGGSLFIALADTTDKPETSGAWKLAVKRGRDGRDGKGDK